MSTKNFKTKAVSRIYEELKDLHHPDFPFLDRHYSPGSLMPVCDMTPYVTEFLLANDIDALLELWKYIGRAGDVDRSLFYNSVRVSVPPEIIISDYAKAELKAIYILCVRMASIHRGAASVASGLAATTLSCREFKIDSSIYDYIIDGVKKEIRGNLNYYPYCRTKDGVSAAAEAIVSDPYKFASLADVVKVIPPMARIVLSDFSSHLSVETRTGWHKKLHFDLGYGNRAFGCSGVQNKQYIDMLDILQPLDVEYPLPASLTKEMLFTALLKHGISPKKSTKKADLVAIANTLPGLLQKLFQQAEPGRQTFKHHLQASAIEWGKRTLALYPVGASILSMLGAQTITYRK